MGISSIIYLKIVKNVIINAKLVQHFKLVYYVLIPLIEYKLKTVFAKMVIMMMEYLLYVSVII